MPDRDDAPRRWAGQQGMAMVTGLVLLFAFTSLGLIWLSREVDRRVSHRSAAQSIAFQAARSGAQQIGTPQLREAADASVDLQLAEAAARSTAAALFDGYGVAGTVLRVAVTADAVEVEVRIDDPAGAVMGSGAARAQAEP